MVFPIQTIQQNIRFLQLYVFLKENTELKAKNLLRPYIFEHTNRRRELVECVFELIRDSNLTIFAMIMEHPKKMPETLPGHIPIQYRFLLERAHFLLNEQEDPSDMAILIFDGDGTAFMSGGLGPGISRYLFRSQQGQSFSNILTTPLFVDSVITPGIQLADMVAGCIRHYQEKQLYNQNSASDTFSSAIKRFYKIIEEKTIDFETEDRPLFGLYRLPEHYLYKPTPGHEGEQVVS